MRDHPYQDQPRWAFWKTGVSQEDPYAIEGIYAKKFDIPHDTKIATAGSCFAQHISRHLIKNGYNVLDVEPPPPALPKELHGQFGFGIYSARYGNIYTVRQLNQLAQEAAGCYSPQDYIWDKEGRYYDALRPAIEPEGLDSAEEVVEHRIHHIERVRFMFENLDLLIFTLGLTEMWVNKESGTVYPTAPGTLIGHFNEDLHTFINAQYKDVISDFNDFQRALKRIRAGRPFKVILTVSPVPLTATASGKHVLVSTTYSKSTLRSAAGLLSTNQNHIDYFPSFEIVANPRLCSTAFEDNLRSVKDEAVENVMKHFFSEHPPIQGKQDRHTRSGRLSRNKIETQCEEALLEAFSQ
jgi:hypothetical protein